MEKGRHSIIKNSEIGKGTVVWHFCNIYGADIGKNVKIGSYVEIQDGVKIGDNSIISSHSFICSLVTVGKNVFIGHSVMTVNDKNPMIVCSKFCPMVKKKSKNYVIFLGNYINNFFF